MLAPCHVRAAHPMAAAEGGAGVRRRGQVRRERRAGRAGPGPRPRQLEPAGSQRRPPRSRRGGTAGRAGRELDERGSSVPRAAGTGGGRPVRCAEALPQEYSQLAPVASVLCFVL